jgi:putative aldouronate transport system substrate-binding protein
VPPLTSSFNDKKLWPKASNIDTGQFAITKQNEHPEATIRWIDYLYSDEGTILASYGIEGTDWKWSENSEYWERILPEGMNPEEYRGGKVTPQAGTPIATIWNADFVLKQDSVFGRHIDSGVEEQYMDHWQIPFPQTYFTEEQEKRISIIESDLNTYIEQMEAKFITGAEAFTKWDDYVKTIERMGLNELIDIYQVAYDTWKNNL